MYEKVSANLDFVQREHEVEKFWEENRIFQQSMDLRKDAPVYTFYDGPPTANGKPHIGHVLTRVIKDMIPRYQTMKGMNVPRKAGWDTHGLPVELEVEKKLHINGKDQIERYGLDPFIQECKKSVWEYKGMWEDFSRTVGYWVDMDHPYVTYENDYIESVWWSLKQIWEKGLLYKGYKIVPYCPRCGTPLSSHEVAQGYKDVKERSAIVRFKVQGEDSYFLAWTTTPWTLPSNVALCVHPDHDYVQVRAGEYTYYLAEALVSTVLGEDVEILRRMKGKDLEYRAYEPLFHFVTPKEKAWYVTCDDYVTLTDGTGIVHIAPAFGEDDANVGRKYGLPLVQLVDAKGCMTQETDWPGVFCKEADRQILLDLDRMGLLFSAPKFEHSYPHCWRCDTPLIYYARESWFIRMTAVKEQLIANNNQIHWMPESIGKGRFGDWLENIQDWGISRDRYWGTPLPIWICACGHQHAIGSIAELKEMSPDCPEDIELHRPYIDAVTLTCPVCGKPMHRVPEVIDCWYDSGSMPFAQHHYPFENQETFRQQFPADFISEAVDQTRGWFYSLLAISTLLFDQPPYKNVIVLGHVQDENGQKMSKSKGNAVDPFQALATYGADAIRWYFYSISAPWLPNRFHGKAVVEGQRKFMSTLWNTYAFYVLYAEIDQFDPTQYTLDPKRMTILDTWLLSRLHTMVRDVDDHLAHYRIPESARCLQDFVDELSNWYVRRSRERYWGTELTEDKISAYLTLYTALVTVAKAAAPMIPFMSESIYRNLVCSLDPTAPISVHLCEYPVADPAWIHPQIEAEMEIVLQAVAQGRAARNAANIKNRQPLAKLYLLFHGVDALPEAYAAIIRDELNVKEIEFVTDADRFVTYTLKPQLKTLGARFGKQLGEVRTALGNLDGSAAHRQLEQEGKITLTLSTGEVTLSAEDLLIETSSKPGFVSFSDNGTTVALDTALTPELIEEGFVKEIINKLQTMRKDAGFAVTDHIRIWVWDNDRLAQIATAHQEEIRRITLGESLETAAPPESAAVKTWEINGETGVFGVERV